jgi:hypothetical protein
LCSFAGKNVATARRTASVREMWCFFPASVERFDLVFRKIDNRDRIVIIK